MASTNENTSKQDLLDAIIKEAAFSGLSQQSIDDALKNIAMDPHEYHTYFPKGMKDIAIAFCQYIDDQMLIALQQNNLSLIRIRDKINHAVETRLHIMTNMEQMVRGCARYWSASSPLAGGSALWTTADIIWTWAGDESTDYNFYTKRSLLSGVILSTTLYWLNDASDAKTDTKTFLDRRIDNVLTFGRYIGGPMKKLSGFFKTCKNKKHPNASPTSTHEEQI